MLFIELADIDKLHLLFFPVFEGHEFIGQLRILQALLDQALDSARLHEHVRLLLEGDAQVAVQWTAPALPEGMELVGYNLYRRHAKRPFPIVPVNAEPLQETKLLDLVLNNGRAYEYRVSALIRVGHQLLESMASPGALITPQ